MNKMEISKESGFSEQIRHYMKLYYPHKIIETGTYLGTGSTTVIASCIKELKLFNSKFFSIEINPVFYEKAKQNLTASGLINYVTLINGLSISKSMLPTPDIIKAEFVDKKWPPEVYIDHPVKDRVDLYYKETNFPGPDNLLYKCVKYFDGAPNFVLLDSGGHIGNLEFSTLLVCLKNRCLIMLDDIYHVKHYESFNFIKNDKRFIILSLSEEKFGYCVALFDNNLC